MHFTFHINYICGNLLEFRMKKFDSKSKRIVNKKEFDLMQNLFLKNQRFNHKRYPFKKIILISYGSKKSDE